MFGTLTSCYIDIDECSDGVHHCAYNCTNTIGSYMCSCGTGYQLNGDGLHCDGQLSMDSCRVSNPYNACLHLLVPTDKKEINEDCMCILSRV